FYVQTTPHVLTLSLHDALPIYDGCSADCQVEAGYACSTPNYSCTVLTYCGDGVINSGEQCDDGDIVRGDTAIWNDGCSGVCTLEDRKSTRLNSSHVKISYAVFC